ncbi:3-ketoacyl-CoA reductase [Wickerhamomyces ciferrii]|uniref:3-ketoacyl-CoA reductase n=1 Tax=Wickerhamomyces ciferrii (strain ATCC 14091 / BCRC 22168 / CBS 111 / JCM 3599 / NBRC 0793 / NRRL Y-1031 F-60-10) TaxID=1206466 RepID=K0KMD2_WICCF|nr:3-ketoacyl-CoA reductase [Wickerhamomyces ciferrii]CCH42539.1 3-ketoacyl-CoA reductase [Wickerhamomyces ciferrii]
MVDPVEKTFDSVYYLGQRAQYAFNSAVGTASEASSAVSDKVVSVCDGLYKITGLGGEGQASEQGHGIIGAGGSGKIWGIDGIKTFQRKNKLVSTLIGASTLGIAGYFLQQLVRSQLLESSKPKRRRAQRLENGARKDVVLIVGSVTEPLTRYVANDLENRGFIVYITSTNSKADLKFFNNESVQDVKSLIVSNEPNNDEFNADQLRKFDYLLSSDHIPFQGASPNKLNLVGIIVIPDLFFPSGKFHMIASSTWSNSMNNKIMLPLNLLTNGLIGVAEKFDSNIIFITPTLSSSVQLTYHSIENITSQFLQNLSFNLSQDYPNLNVTNIKLGSISVNCNNSKKNYGIKGIGLKSLHYKIFDLIYNDDNNSIEYIGTGSRFLNNFGGLIPRWLIRNYFDNYFGTQ